MTWFDVVKKSESYEKPTLESLERDIENASVTVRAYDEKSDTITLTIFFSSKDGFSSGRQYTGKLTNDNLPNWEG